MSAFDDALATYKATTIAMGLDGEDPLLTKVARSLGPSIYNPDSTYVLCCDADELVRIKDKFLVRKLGLPDTPDLVATIQSICERIEGDRTHKPRAVVYYALTKHFHKDAVYE